MSVRPGSYTIRSFTNPQGYLQVMGLARIHERGWFPIESHNQRRPSVFLVTPSEQGNTYHITLAEYDFPIVKIEGDWVGASKDRSLTQDYSIELVGGRLYRIRIPEEDRILKLQHDGHSVRLRAVPDDGSFDGHWLLTPVFSKDN